MKGLRLLLQWYAQGSCDRRVNPGLIFSATNYSLEGGFNLLRNKNKNAESDGIPQRCVGKKKQCKSRATDISARRTVRSSIE
jgi:hypothetical protein